MFTNKLASLPNSLFILFLNFVIGSGSFVTLAAAPPQPEKTDSLMHTNHIFKKSIKTVELFKKGWPLSYPILELNSSERLVLNFDDLSSQAGNYYYTFIHCNADWNPSDISETEYLDGFPENQLNHFEYSFNTTVKYIHYSLELPNEDIRFLASGNYILLVYQDYNRDDPVLTRRFMVKENRFTVHGSLKRPGSAQYSETGQEIEISVNYAGAQVRDPYTEIEVVVSQNGRWDNAVYFQKPDFLKNREVVYSFGEKNIFPAGNEFRYFDIKSLRYQTEYVKYIDFKNPYYNIRLTTSRPRFNKAYFYQQEMNGKYFIKIQEGRQSQTEADYVKVYFTLENSYPFEGEVYIFGALSDWVCTSENHMIYNYDTKAYEGSLFLKQGVYNYVYAIRGENHSGTDITFIEGSFYETENDYLIFAYYHAPGARYDRLVGVQQLNSLNKPR